MSNATNYNFISNNVKGIQASKKSSKRTFGNLGIGMSASVLALPSASAFEYKDCHFTLYKPPLELKVSSIYF